MDPPPDCASLFMKRDDDHTRKSLRKSQSSKDDGGDFLDLTSNTGRFGNAGSIPSVRSKAVITYSASKDNTLYSRLAPQTDLNHAPSNWLRKTVGLRPETVFPGARYAASPGRSFSAFSMASTHLQQVGKIDVVSDAENIKKLLKMPYSKAHVSMTIHRIGRTLLLENFDIRKYTAEESEWKWFRDFYQEVLQGQDGSKLLKKKSPSSQNDRMMLSKFLYHSIYKDNKLKDKPSGEFAGSGVCIDESQNREESNVEVVEIKESEDYEKKITDVTPMTTIADENSSANSQLATSDRRWRYWTPNENTGSSSQFHSEEAFDRNILWTFEDLKMILGTNMPIFGGGKYPAVSLRLRDSNKPINVLTGMDYWLDNLICNVPELLMCFHVNGIVQNYEVIKTEDIPQLQHSSFSPQVVKDIAQNILSFLKSNCTKEGHTYWLFKGSEDDVVKLYDLTTLCNTSNQETSSNSQQNPYIFSVAMLLYKTAISLMQSNDACDHRITVKKLLGHCVELLDSTKYQPIVSRAICILSSLSLPDPGLDKSNKESTQECKENDAKAPDWKACDTCAAHIETDAGSTRKNSEGPRSTEIASISSVNELSIPQKFISSTAPFNLMRSPKLRPRSKDNNSWDQSSEIENGCIDALFHIVSGFKVLMTTCKEQWQVDLLQHLSRNSALAYYRLAEQASNCGKLGRALNRSRLALQSYETFDSLDGSKIHNQEPEMSQAIPPDFHLLLPKLLSLCGEVQFRIVQDIRAHGAVSSSHHEDFNTFSDPDGEILKSLKSIFSPGGKYNNLTVIADEQDQALATCAECYETALDAMKALGYTSAITTNTKSIPVNKDVKQKFKSKARKSLDNSSTTQPVSNGCQSEASEELRTTLIRRHGHVVNEMGALALNRVVKYLSEETSEETPNQKMMDAWNQANSHFESAYNSFTQVNDIVNQALVLSNTGRLMRVTAQCYCNREDGLLSAKERKCFTSAIDRYQEALTLLNPKDVKRSNVKSESGTSTGASVYDNISWELSSCYFSMAQILQDNAPGEQSASEEAEKEVISLLNNSLKYCKDIWENSPNQPIALYRQAKIHHRLASLHHNSYRNCNDSQKIKYLRNLAEKYYDKAMTILEGLEHPNELLRVQLEKLAVREHYISRVTNANSKLKLLVEGLELICGCAKPLNLVCKSTKLSHKMSHADGVVKDTLSSSEVDPVNVSDIASLMRVLTTILQSFLLSLVKLTSLPGYGESKILRSRSLSSFNAQVCKDLYSKTLRNLQPLMTSDKSFDSSLSLGQIHENVTCILGVLDDVSKSLT